MVTYNPDVVVIYLYALQNQRQKDHMMMTFLLQKEEEKHVTSILAMVKAESPVCTINNTSGQVVASLWVKV